MVVKGPVTIDESSNTVQYFDAAGDPELLWHSSESLHKIERRAKASGREAMKNGLATLMEATFAKPHGETQQNLNLFVQTSEARGVEKVICASHFLERREHRAAVFKAVMETQELARKSDWQPSKLSAKLREASMEYSYKAKVFARKMAIADEAACSPPTAKESTKCTPSTPTHNPVSAARRQPQETGRSVLAVLGCF